MPAVLTQGSAIACVHGGTVQPKSASHPLTVDHQSVLLQSDLLNAPIAGCTNTNTAIGQKPCLMITAITAGLATKLTVTGQPVLLETAQGLTDAVPPLPVLWQVQSAGQSKLTAS
jgi:hypothetical protein